MSIILKIKQNNIEIKSNNFNIKNIEDFLYITNENILLNKNINYFDILLTLVINNKIFNLFNLRFNNIFNNQKKIKLENCKSEINYFINKKNILSYIIKIPTRYINCKIKEIIYKKSQ